MTSRSVKAGKIIGIIIAIPVIYFSSLFLSVRIPLIGKKTEHKVHIAFGFHGNLYHSFRIDTNDEAGFGKDIRIIRKTIEVLDKYNNMGIPVKAVWDFENLFSLQETLPKYAPDIILNLKRRIKENGDEAILMSYNNGLASAMTSEELKDSISRAISNPQGSGLNDLFAEWSPIVRPQEMMSTPGNFNLYKELGINYISLYNSAIAFDSFRLFSRKLNRTEAHNPMQYKNPETGEEIIVIPTYNIGDLIENTSLRQWAIDLHRRQLKGEINQDVLLFINFDADHEYLYGFDFPAHLDWLPNTGGIDQLIGSISDLEFVEYTNLITYLKDHKPVGEFYFGQDTADGSFNGYNSWSEKAYSHTYWTQLMKDRRNHHMVKKAFQVMGQKVPDQLREIMNQSYQKRMRLLSTTNFGMATPYLARARERAVEEIIRDMNTLTAQIHQKTSSRLRQYLSKFPYPQSPHEDLKLEDSFILLNAIKENKSKSGVFLKFRIPGQKNDAKVFYITDQQGNLIPSLNVSQFSGVDDQFLLLKLFVPSDQILKDGVYFLYSGEKGLFGNTIDGVQTKAGSLSLKNRFIEVKFNKKGQITELTYNKVKQLEAGSLTPNVVYQGKKFTPRNLILSVIKDGKDGVSSVRLSGEWKFPGVIMNRPGKVDYTYTLLSDVPYLFIEGKITYPDTPRHDFIKGYNPSLARKIDKGWLEVAPVEIIFAPTTDKSSPFCVLKNNFLDTESSYQLDYYRHSDKNLNLDNINNHITAEYIGVSGKGKGFAVGMETTVQANFAFSPMKMKHENGVFHLKANPFGTYSGEQYYQPTWANGLGFEIGFLLGEQYETAAPTYNGYTNQLSMILAFFDGERIPGKIKNHLEGFAHPPIIITQKATVQPVQDIPKITTPNGFLALYGNDGVYFHWEIVGDHTTQYKIYCGTESGNYEKEYEVTGTTLFTNEFIDGKRFEKDQKYYARIQASFPDGQTSEKSEEIIFVATPPRKIRVPPIPLSLQLKIIWANIKARFH